MKNINDLDVGDTVALNSGSPSMTVQQLYKDLVECVYWSEKEFIVHVFDYRTIFIRRKNGSNASEEQVDSKK